MLKLYLDSYWTTITMLRHTTYNPSIASRIAVIASVISVLMLVVTAAVALPHWSFFLIPLWGGILFCSLLARVVGLRMGSTARRTPLLDGSGRRDQEPITVAPGGYGGRP
jgi:hypothetical protein